MGAQPGRVPVSGWDELAPLVLVKGAGLVSSGQALGLAL